MDNPECDARKDFSPYIAVWLFGTIKTEQDSDHYILTDIYFESDHLDRVVPFHSVPYILTYKSTRQIS